MSDPQAVRVASAGPGGPPDATRARIAVVMGVAGSGKSTIGVQVAELLEVPFADADAFHPQSNIDKMAAGHPLDDDDRRPWLEAIGEWLHSHRTSGAVVACSALKRSYRDILRAGAPDTAFCHLVGPMSVAHERVASRPDHFMPSSLIQSQYDTLENLETDEYGITLDFTRPEPELAAELAEFLATPPAAIGSTAVQEG